MNLIDLEPEWLESNGQRVAIIFRCPHCRDPKLWLTCFFVATGGLPRGPDGRRGDRLIIAEYLRTKGHPDPDEAAYHDVVGCNPTMAWSRTSDDFATMSIMPSVDASASGHWHGFITNGAIA